MLLYYPKMIRNTRTLTSPSLRRTATQRRARERHQRSADVLETARRLFIRRGYGGTTMADIAGGSGFAVGTLYELFPSKEAMLRRLLEERIDRLLDRLREAAARADNPRQQIEQIVRTHLGFFQEDPVLLRLTLSAWSGSDFTVRRDLGERIDKKHRAYLALLVPVFERGMREGVFARRPPARLAIALTGLLNSLIRRWVREPRLDLVGEGDALIEIFFYGVTRRASARRGPR
jgi:AcrR family transcriptional regulator